MQLLNIAGTGPIYGALMGACFGPVVFLWIVFGSILGGAVHDYMSGMISCRHGGKVLKIKASGFSFCGMEGFSGGFAKNLQNIVSFDAGKALCHKGFKAPAACKEST